MLKRRIKLLTSVIVLILSTTINSCVDDPEFADTPRIEFENIYYVEQRNLNEPDSLVITINFEDGDGDLGLGTDENAPPFNERNYFSNKTGNEFAFGIETLEDLLVISDTATIDSLRPLANSEFACLFWDEEPEITVLDQSGNSVPLDTTAYYRLNERHNNIFIRFYNDVNNDGTIDEASEELDFRTVNGSGCDDNYDARFPILDDLEGNSALEGSISRAMVQSISFREVAFLGDRLTKLKVYILDRAGNRSNTIETPEFTLRDIQRN
ncbi:MAG: hypothetical protein AAF693_04010 [Bacteroidota bacterium]